MTTQGQPTLAIELQVALDQLEQGLRQAADATAALAALAPRIAGIDALIGQIERAIGSGRTGQQAAAVEIAAPPPAPAVVYSRPTLVVPGALHIANGQAPTGDTPSGDTITEPSPEPVEVPQIPVMQPASADGEKLTSFRLAFESTPGPLDLRAVDDALSAHPAVRDVALLDYDGHKATLKVWVTASARPTDIEASLREQTPGLFSSDAVVSIVALTDVA